MDNLFFNEFENVTHANLDKMLSKYWSNIRKWDQYDSETAHSEAVHYARILREYFLKYPEKYKEYVDTSRRDDRFLLLGDDKYTGKIYN